jgi:hypothetical protein
MSNTAENIIQLNTAVDVQQRTDIISECEALEIRGQSDVEKSVELERGLKDNKKAIEDGFKPIVEEAHRIHKALTAKRGAFLKPIEDALLLIQRKRNAFLSEQERIRREQEAAILKAQKEAEEAERLRQAELAELNGDTEGAEAILSGQAAVHTPFAPSAPVEQTKTEGLVTKTIYKAECTDKMALVKAIAAGRTDLLDLFVIDQSALNKLAAALKDNFNVAGCTLKKDITTHTRA